jgi:hypothetical protein
MNIILSRISKTILKILFLFLITILFISSVNIGAVFLLAIGVLTFTVPISLANDVKKSNNSNKIVTVVLIDAILYSLAFLFYGLGNIGGGEYGLLFVFTLFGYLLLLVISTIIGIILVIRSKNDVSEGNPNKTLSVILLLVLVTLFYSTMVSGVAKITQNTGFCFMHIEIKDNSFIFNKGMRDYCIYKIALDTSNIAYCEQMKSGYTEMEVSNSLKNKCFFHFAKNLEDKSVCYRMNDSTLRGVCLEEIISKSAMNKADLSICETSEIEKDYCYLNFARGDREKDNGDPEICGYIKNYGTKYHCYTTIAVDKRDVNICEKYFPPDNVLINQGVKPSDYSRNMCIREVENH